MNLIEEIRNTNGKIFRAEFIKRDGSLRKIVARTKVSKGITGKGMAYNPLDRGMIVVYDMAKKDYRMINSNTIKSFKCGATQWTA